MGRRVFICQTEDGTCAEHGPFIYYCSECHERWAQANPERVAEIRRLAHSAHKKTDQ